MSAPFPDGYAAAFYDIAKMLDIGARADSPANVWAKEMRPRIVSALDGRGEAVVRAKADALVRSHAARLGMDAFAAEQLSVAIEAITTEPTA